MKLYTFLTCAILASVATAGDCPIAASGCTGECPSDCKNCEYSCSCDKNPEKTCPATPVQTLAFCGIYPEESDGCGGTYGEVNCSTNCTPPEECQPDGTCACIPTGEPLCPTNIPVGGDCSDIPPSSDGCFTDYDGDDCSDNCDSAFCYEDVCCQPSEAPQCPASIPNGEYCSVPSGDDGCGGTYASRSCADNCADGGVCTDGICQSSCTDCSIELNGETITGSCHPVEEQPANTLEAGSCAIGCGICYVSSTDSGLCSGTPNGQGCLNGKCGCFKTNSGASCNDDNLLDPKPVPLPGNGGGCSENLCQALATKLGYNAACCPQC